jgi:hypothetical protein
LWANSNASKTIFTNVEARSNFDSTDVGWDGRDHTMNTMRTGQCNLEDSFFDKVSVNWNYDV